MLESFLQILIILLAANGAPVIAALFFRTRGQLAIDLGRQLPDGHPLFGSSKTWRGLAAALLASCALSLFFGYGPVFGLISGALAMAGDLLSSFVKRRRGLAPSDRSTGLDQIPESLLPSIYAVAFLGVAWWWAVIWSLSFTLTQMLLSRFMYWLHLRKRPY